MGRDYVVSAATRTRSKAKEEFGVKNSSRSGTIPLNSTQNLKQLHSITATIFTQSCNSTFKLEATACGVEVKKGLFVHPSDNVFGTLRNISGEHKICYEIQSSAHFFIPLTVHDSHEFICSWIGHVNNCFILLSSSSESHFVLPGSDFSLEIIT